MTGMESRAHGAFNRVSREGVPTGEYRKRSAFAVLNGPLKVQQSVVTNRRNTRDSGATRPACWSETTSRASPATFFWLLGCSGIRTRRC